MITSPGGTADGEPRGLHPTRGKIKPEPAWRQCSVVAGRLRGAV